MTAIPTDITYGKVVGRFIKSVADAVDPDRLPDVVAAEGEILFTPSTPNFKATAPSPTTVIRTPIRCTLNANGDLIDAQNAPGVWLVAGTYKVTYNLTGTTIQAHNILVTTAHTDSTPLDLTNAVPPTGPGLTLTQYEQLTSQIAAVQGGAPGKSAYQLALDAGFTGTQSAWLTSLAGAPGGNGKSAYQLAQDAGFSGTQAAWLTSLQGAKGDPGDPGTPGKSAYQTAVDAGFSGSQAAWITSLHGAAGDPGKSAYQVAVDNGYSGTITQWLLSLVGPKGDPGDANASTYFKTVMTATDAADARAKINAEKKMLRYATQAAAITGFTNGEWTVDDVVIIKGA